MLRSPSPRRIPAELETISLKALAKNPEERYATAKELAEDLERFLADRPIQARRPTLPQKVRKWARRNRAVVWSAGISFGVMALFLIVGLLVAYLNIAPKQAEVDRVNAATEDTRKDAADVKAVADRLGVAAGRIREQVESFFQTLRAA